MMAARYVMKDDRISKYVLRGLGLEFQMFRTSLNQRDATTFAQLADLLIKEEILMKDLDHLMTTFR